MGTNQDLMLYIIVIITILFIYILYSYIILYYYYIFIVLSLLIHYYYSNYLYLFINIFIDVRGHPPVNPYDWLLIETNRLTTGPFIYYMYSHIELCMSSWLTG